MRNTQLIIVERQGTVLSLVINRADKRNALSSAVQRQLQLALKEHREDASIGLVTLRGAGDKAFAAGGDLDELDAIRARDDAYDMAQAGKQTLGAIRDFPAPVVAFINGAALGGGAELACACDMRFAASHARMGFIQANLAITTAWGGSWDLFQLVGPSRALQLLCRGELLNASEAFGLRLVSAIAGDEQSDCEAFEVFIGPMRDKAPQVLRGYKKLKQEFSAQRPREWYHIESEILSSTWVSDQHWQAVKNAKEKKS